VSTSETEKETQESLTTEDTPSNLGETPEEIIKTLEQMNADLRKHAIRAETEKRLVENELVKLRKETRQLKSEIDRLKRPPLLIGTVREVLLDGRVIVKSSSGPEFVVHLAEFVRKEGIKVGSRVSLNQQTLTVVGVLAPGVDPIVSGAEVIDKPDITYTDIGGLDDQINEVREAVELPLLRKDLFKRVGIDPPGGVLLIGPPGTGKTMVAKAVANNTKANFIRLVGSELVQKFIGEGGRLVRELFELAKEKSPSIIFIDELDAIGAKRIETGTSGDREVQRTLMQLLAEMDGFEPLSDVKIIAATNRPDILDDALMRPGRFDRIVTIPNPDDKARLQILNIIFKTLTKEDDIKLPEIARITDGFSGAQLKALSVEAGMFAIREERFSISQKDLRAAMQKIKETVVKESLAGYQLDALYS